MTIAKPPQHDQVTLCMLDAIERRTSTVPALCECNDLPKVGAPIPYHVLDDFHGRPQEFYASHIGWRALVIAGNNILLAGVDTDDDSYLFKGLKDGKYPEFLFKACSYAERKFLMSDSYFSPAILFVPMLNEHYLWLHNQIDYFVKIPIRHNKPRFKLIREIRVGEVAIAKIVPERNLPRNATKQNTPKSF